MFLRSGASILIFTLMGTVPFAASAGPLAVMPPPASPGALNPQVTEQNIDRTICDPGWSKQVRPSEDWSEDVKRRLLTTDYPQMSLDDFELDHRVPIEVGGCPNCLNNLWLQPWRNPEHHTCDASIMLDAACKDRLEDAVHRAICKHRMTLEQGQAVFLGDWMAAYKTIVEDDSH